MIKNRKFRLLVESLQEDPEMLEARPVVTDPTLTVLGGNMRVKAAREAGLREIPVYIADWDEVKQRRFIIKDNASYGEWDWDMLANEGYEPDELESWGVDVPEWKEEKPEVEDDHYEIPDDITTDIQPGDRFEIGPHRLIVADSTQSQTFETLLPTQWADLVLTDPPYNIDYEGKTAERKKIQNDKQNDGNFRRFLTEAFTAINSKVKAGGCWYVWHAPTESPNFGRAMVDAGILTKQALVWVKNHFVMGRQDYQWQHETCYYGWKPGGPHYFIDDRTLVTTLIDNPPDIHKLTKPDLVDLLAKILDLPSTTIKHDRPSRSTEHPTMKPLPLIGELISNSTRPGEIVLDGFLGSGTTMVAAHQLGRRCFGVELDPKYAQVTLDRMTALDPNLKIVKQ